MINFKLTKIQFYLALPFCVMAFLPFLLLVIDIELPIRFNVFSYSGYLSYLSILLTINLVLIKVFPKTFGQWQKFDVEQKESWSLSKIIYAARYLIILLGLLLLILILLRIWFVTQ